VDVIVAMGKNVVVIANVIIVYMMLPYNVIIINFIVGTKDKHEPVSLTWSKL
jgi:hypothetical protein